MAVGGSRETSVTERGRAPARDQAAARDQPAARAMSCVVRLTLVFAATSGAGGGGRPQRPSTAATAPATPAATLPLDDELPRLYLASGLTGRLACPLPPVVCLSRETGDSPAPSWRFSVLPAFSGRSRALPVPFGRSGASLVPSWRLGA